MERSVRAREPGDEVTEWIAQRFEERLWHAYGQRDAERVPEPAGVFDRGPVLRSGEADPDDPASRLQLHQPVRLGTSSLRLRRRQWAEHLEQVCGALQITYRPGRIQPLQLRFYLVDRGRIEQLAELGLAEQLGEQGGVERQCGRTPLHQRGVALVEERSDISEQQGTSEWGRRRSLDLDHPHRSRA